MKESLHSMATCTLNKLEKLASAASSIALSFECENTKSLVDERTGELLGPRGYGSLASTQAERIRRDFRYTLLILEDIEMMIESLDKIGLAG